MATSSENSSLPGGLTAAQLAQFRKDGYLVLPGWFDPAPLLTQAKALLESFSLENHPMTKFSTGGDDGRADKHISDRYFLESGDKIRYFLEEDAVGADGQLTCSKQRAVNKIGHSLHVLDPIFANFSKSQRVQDLARSLQEHTDPRILQSMVICKQPSIGGAVPIHNDSTFLYTDPPSAVGLWFALEDCTSTNGCLSFLPGSHRRLKAANKGVPSFNDDSLGPIRGVNRRFVRADPDDPDQGTTFKTLGQEEEALWDEGEAKKEECSAGSLVLIHGSVLHKSEKNLSPKSRYIYTFHMIEGDSSRAIYDRENWLQPTPEMPFTSLYST